MTIEFETAWLVLSAKIFLVALCGGLLIVTIKAIFDAIKIHRKLKTLVEAEDHKGFVTETTFEQFKGEVKSELIGINKRLDNIERTPSTLVERQNKKGKEGQKNKN